MKPLYFLVFVIAIFLSSCEQKPQSPVDAVDPFIGTGGHGHTFPGATMPFGMVQLSPDTRKDSWDGCSGYHYSDSTIMGFSHTHLSGTGVGDYGDIRLMPTTGKLHLEPGTEENTQSGYRSHFSHSSESATPGYYKVLLEDYQIQAELTTSERVGFHKYHFPQTDSAHIIIDLFEGVTSDQVLDAFIQIENDSTISGYRRTKGWANDQHLYFYASFSSPFKHFGIQHNNQNQAMKTYAQGGKIVAWVDYKTAKNTPILVKVGISAVDVAGAKNNLKAEIPHWDFELQRGNAKNSWNKALNKIKIGKSHNKEDRSIFYTALYHTMIAPNLYNDADGRYRGHDMEIHKTDSGKHYTVFSLWDTFRALHPLFTIIERNRTAEMVRSMLDMQSKGGLLPVWELAANETQCMIGYHAVPVIADAWINGIRDFDEEKALQAMIKSANQDLHGLKWQKSLGYIPADKESESVSKTLEYAYDDWCIARMAENLGNQQLADSFYQRAQNYKNLYDNETKFFRGRQNGGFITPFDPAQVNFMLTEANSWQYNFFVPQDIGGHIDLMGGDEAYATMLDSLFTGKTAITGRKQADITGLIGQYAHGNEPSHHMAYLYNYVGEAYKTQALIHQIMNELYHAAPNGLSGNEDCGQMSAWYVFSALGFYPVTPASGQYIIGVPCFDNATIELENGNTFTVEATNFSPDNKYIQQLTLNGAPYPYSFIDHETIQHGGILRFVMGPQPDKSWASEKKHRPQRKITGDQLVATPSIKADSKTFTDSIQIRLQHPKAGAQIFYSLDGSLPTAKSQVYSDAISLTASTQIRVMAKIENKQSSAITGNFYKIPAGRTIDLASSYSPQYPAGGDIALIDRQHGNTDFRTGSWQGYQGVDLEATVDLGKRQKIKSISIGFLQDQRSWIFMPERVHFSLSVDGRNFTEIGVIQNTIPATLDGSIIKHFEMDIVARKARFVRVIATNRKVCPPNHLGGGEPAWIFADEISIH
ncbi:MAG: GH92 family glycosyl hydrolase [Bacteroidetes bacterium]|nr:GH92 family glycosyl hydrolase [Bacteroidota bacterium]